MSLFKRLNSDSCIHCFEELPHIVFGCFKGWFIWHLYLQSQIL